MKSARVLPRLIAGIAASLALSIPAFVALQVKPDKMPRLERETFTA